MTDAVLRDIHIKAMQSAFEELEKSRKKGKWIPIDSELKPPYWVDCYTSWHLNNGRDWVSKAHYIPRDDGGGIWSVEDSSILYSFGAKLTAWMVIPYFPTPRPYKPKKSKNND